MRGKIYLFPARESLASDIPAGNGKMADLFLQCRASIEMLWIWSTYTVFVVAIYNMLNLKLRKVLRQQTIALDEGWAMKEIGLVADRFN